MDILQYMWAKVEVNSLRTGIWQKLLLLTYKNNFDLVVNKVSYLWVLLHLSLSTGCYLLRVRLIMSESQIYVQLKPDTVHQEVISLTHMHQSELDFNTLYS